MKIKCRLLLEDLERLNNRLKQVAQDNFSPLSEAQLNWKASPSEWSIAECLEHLNIVSAFYLPEMQKGIQKGKEKGWKRLEFYNTGLLGNALVGGVRLGDDNKPQMRLNTFRAYDPVSSLKKKDSSESQLDGHEVLARFVDCQKETLQMLKSAEMANLNKIKIPIAIARFIKIRLGDMLRFLVYHSERHIVQAQKVQGHERFPRNECA